MGNGIFWNEIDLIGVKVQEMFVQKYVQKVTLCTMRFLVEMFLNRNN